jgi:hypothetical protein
MRRRIWFPSSAPCSAFTGLSKIASLAPAMALWLVVCASGVWSQQLRVASYNMERLGENRKDFSALARVVSSFDLVAKRS